MKGQAVAVLIRMICALSTIGAQVEVPIVAPEPEECQTCTAVNLSQRTRFPDKTSPFEEWVLWCEGCRGSYPEWTLQATFLCRPWDQAGFSERFVRKCSDETCMVVEEPDWFCLTRHPTTGKITGEVRTSCACCLGCRECARESRPPICDRPRSITISHGQRVTLAVGGTDPDGDIVAVSVMEPRHGRLTSRSAPRGGAAVASVYLYDPDTSVRGLAFPFEGPTGYGDGCGAET